MSLVTQIHAHQKGETMSLSIASLINQEAMRQQQTLCLIASENYASKAVMDAMGSCLTNKYAEGYPGNRYYAGCEIVDQIEQEAIDLGKKLLNAEHVNVQPHSGSSANLAVYMSVLQAGDTILGMNLASGGHLTHGHPLNFSGKLFNIVAYNVNPATELIDYDELAMLAKKHQPKMIVAGASAYPRIIDFEKIGQIAKENNAYFLADIAHIAGLIVAGLHPHPFPHADFITSTTHKTLRGPRGGLIACKAAYAKKINAAVFPGIQGGPLMQIIAAKAIAFQEALDPSFTEYQKQILINTKALAQTFLDHEYQLVSGGTDNHLCIVNVKAKAPHYLTGKQAEKILESLGIIVNRNMIPFDTESPLHTSGIRIGTPAITTRGFTESATKELALLIIEALHEHQNTNVLDNIKNRVATLCNQYPF